MRLLILPLVAMLAGCNALGGVPPEAVNAIASAGGGCVAVESIVMGKAIMMVGSADKGVIRNGSVVISGACGGISISNTAIPPVPAVK